MLICHDESDMDLEDNTLEVDPEQVPQEEVEMTLSIHALLGYKSNQTLQLQEFTKKQKVLMLVDSGSTNNFIDLNLERKLGLDLLPVKKVKVAVANGFKIQVQYGCQKVS